MKNSIVLSICIPAYNRPIWLKRALESITVANSENSEQIEIIVTDDSTSTQCKTMVKEVLGDWHGQWQYIWNDPKLGMAKNWNLSIQMATGEYIIVLHDDDFLVIDGVKNLLKTINQVREQYPVLLFGVQVMNEQEKILKTQTFSKTEYLPPKKALINLLSNSSFVRFPAIAMQRVVFEEVGYFDPQWGEPTDIDMWIRLFSQYGVYCLPLTTCAYTVHSEALTMGVFNEKIVKTLLGLFERVATLNLLTRSDLKDCQSKFFHQFILAGGFRMLRRGQFREFHQVMQLFKIPTIKNLEPPKKWLIFRVTFRIIDQIYTFIT